MEQMQQTDNKDQELLNLMNQLAQIQAQLTAIISTRFERQTEDNVKNKVEQKKEFVESEAQRYGQDPSSADSLITDYENALRQVKSEYSAEKNLWLAQSLEFEKKEFDYIMQIEKLKKELEQSKSTPKQPEKQEKENPGKDDTKDSKGLLAELIALIKRMREASRESRENVTDTKSRCDSTIDEISDDKEMVVSDKNQNFISRLFSRIRDRIGGKDKFNQNVIEPLKKKTEYIKTEILPKVKEKIQEEVLPKLKDLLEKGKEKISELDLKDKFDKLMENAKAGIKVIIEKGKVVKDKVMELFAKGMEMAKEGISHVAEKTSETLAR